MLKNCLILALIEQLKRGSLSLGGTASVQLLVLTSLSVPVLIEIV